MSTRKFLDAKRSGVKLSMVTCYDYTFARLVSQTAVDAILVGDSLAMVVHGYSSTLSATIDLMRIHTEAVVRGAPEKFIVADLPFLSFRKGIGPALDAADVLMKAGAHAVKLEGVAGHEDVVSRLVESGIPVMGHLGMQPQLVRAYGGFQVQGREERVASEILQQAKQLETLGAFAIVLECIPAALAQKISAELQIPTIGIGAGAGCDGQVLVLHDLLGLNIDFQPKFVRRFVDGAATVQASLAKFDESVKTNSFPSVEESYS
jgi:3-methyl-2-oxobutanoate hydroxymethyltransferase